MRRLGLAQDVQVLLRERPVVPLEGIEKALDGLGRLRHLVLERDVGPAAAPDEARELAAREEELVERLDVRRWCGVRRDVELAPDRGVRVVPSENSAFPARRVDPRVLLRLGRVAHEPPGHARAERLVEVGARHLDGLAGVRVRGVLEEAAPELEDGGRERDELGTLLRREVDARLFKVAQEGGGDGVGGEEGGRLGWRVGGEHRVERLEALQRRASARFVAML